MSVFRSVAPSNIAIIKYMGKVDANKNLPANSSVSLTLKGLRTVSELECFASHSPQMQWSGQMPKSIQDGKSFSIPRLEGRGLEKVERHIARVIARAPELLRAHGFEVREGAAFETRVLTSANSFPAATGIASSASSFAAITVVVLQSMSSNPHALLALLSENSVRADEFKRACARLSREGSGSSCRSFEGPWVLWTGEQVRAIESKMEPLSDIVILCAQGEKAVSSSEAHARVTTSPLWGGRVERAEARAQTVVQAVAEGNQNLVAEVAWQEFWGMHSLFHTAREPFTYWAPETLRVLKWCEKQRQEAQAKKRFLPIITMDAGAQVHFIIPTSELTHWTTVIDRELMGLHYLTDNQGMGAQ